MHQSERVKDIALKVGPRGMHVLFLPVCYQYAKLLLSLSRRLCILLSSGVVLSYTVALPSAVNVSFYVTKNDWVRTVTDTTAIRVLQLFRY